MSNDSPLANFCAYNLWICRNVPYFITLGPSYSFFSFYSISSSPPPAWLCRERAYLLSARFWLADAGHRHGALFPSTSPWETMAGQSFRGRRQERAADRQSLRNRVLRYCGCTPQFQSVYSPSSVNDVLFLLLPSSLLQAFFYLPSSHLRYIPKKTVWI